MKTVTIIIPCRNEEDNISKCLDSLIQNDYPKKYLDILAIDGLSADNTRKIVNNYIKKYSYIRLITNEKKIKPTALNIGIQISKSDVVMRIDAHAIYEKGYISKLVKGLYEYGVDNIGGVRKTHIGESIIAQSIGIAISHPFAVGNAFWRTGTQGIKEVDSVFCGCYKREVFEKTGLFNEYLIRTQDREFNFRLKKQGGKILLDPNVTCLYYPRKKLIGYIKWIYNGSFWLFYARRFTKTKMISSRNTIPIIFVLSQVLFCIFAFWWLEGLWLVSALFCFYFIVAFAVSFVTAVKQKRILLFPTLLLIFGLSHYGYGFGGIVGFLKYFFSKRRYFNE